MSQKYYTIEEAKARSTKFIYEQAEILRANLRASKKKSNDIHHV